MTTYSRLMRGSRLQAYNTTNYYERRNSHKGGCRKKDANNITTKIHGYTLDAST